jgi:CelD/BcsL family acetyltransferase involved in cellulose biosynthesis
MAPRELTAVAPPAASRSVRLRIEVASGIEELRPHVAAWDALAAEALEPNVFYESWMLLPALEAFGKGHRFAFVLVFEGEGHAARLCGFFPFERRRHYKGLPMPVLTLWKYVHCFLSTPLLSADRALGCLQAVVAWAASDRRGAPLLELRQIPGDGAFQACLAEGLERAARRNFVYGQFVRPLLVTCSDGESYLRSALASRSRRKLERRWRRLAEGGRLEVDVLGRGGDVETWTDEFLRLEASGWKGRAGSALACSAAGRRFFTSVTREAHARGRLMMLALRLNGRPVAQQCGFLAADGAFSFKVAYDERYARFSPGVLAEMANIRQLHRRRRVKWMDSCAVLNNGVTNRLWTQRRGLESVVVSTGGAASDVVVAALPLLRWLSHSVRPRGVMDAMRDGGGLLTCVALPAF